MSGELAEVGMKKVLAKGCVRLRGAVMVISFFEAEKRSRQDIYEKAGSF